MGFLKRHPLIIIILSLLLAIQVFSLSTDEKRIPVPFSRFILNLTYYPQKFMYEATDSIINIWGNYIDLVDVRDENKRLMLENAQLRHENMQLLEAKSQNDRLKKLLKFKEYAQTRTLTANVIAGSPSITRTEVVVIDKGHNDGLSEGMPIATFEGIVGRVYLVGDRDSEVMLITDPLSAVDAYIHRTRARGIVKGTGSGCVMEYIDSKTDLSIGDKVISSGKDGFFPKGVLIGTVEEIEQKGSFLSAKVSPNVELDSLEEVLVILDPSEKMALNE
jgi:rod shape-determining protein MreC